MNKKELEEIKKFFKENAFVVVDKDEPIIFGEGKRRGEIALNEIDWEYIEEELGETKKKN